MAEADKLIAGVEIPKVPFEPGNLADLDQRQWKAILDGEEVSFDSLSIVNEGRGLDFTMHSMGAYEQPTRHEPDGGGVVMALTTEIEGETYVVSILSKRALAGGWVRELPRGFKEKGESAENAVKRETEEETGHRIGAFTLMADQMNDNNAFSRTDGEGEGMHFVTASIDPSLVEADPNNPGSYRFIAEIRERKEAVEDGFEKIKQAEIVSINRFMKESKDSISKAAMADLMLLLVGPRFMAGAGVELEKPKAQPQIPEDDPLAQHGAR